MLFGAAAPSLSRRLLGDFCAAFWRQAGSSRGTSLTAHGRCGWVFTTFFRRWLAVFDLAARDIDNELGGLAKIAGAFRALGHHPGKPC
jgi:hypothetical protein